jgi:phytoene/squalene synthetase
MIGAAPSGEPGLRRSDGGGQEERMGEREVSLKTAIAAGLSAPDAVTRPAVDAGGSDVSASKPTEYGLASCRRQVWRSPLRPWVWLVRNLPREKQDHLAAVFGLAVRAGRLLDMRVSRQVRKDQWADLRDELRDAFRSATPAVAPEIAAVAHVARVWRIPIEYFFDHLAGIEMGIRYHRFEAFDQWRQFGCRVGGSLVLISAPIVGLVRTGYESAALALGQAVHLTSVLASCGTNCHRLISVLPAVDAFKCDVRLDEIDPDRPPAGWTQLVDLEIERIEAMYREGAELLNYLDFDGRRVVQSLLSACQWIVDRIRMAPEALLKSAVELPQGRWRLLQLRHFLGTEGGSRWALARHSSDARPSAH